MKRCQALPILLRSGQTVLNTKDIARLWGDSPAKLSPRSRSKLSYMVKEKQLIRLTRGIYALDANYDRKELGYRLVTPSYLSFQSVLSYGSVVAEPTTIQLAAAISTYKTINGQKYRYRRVKAIRHIEAKDGVINHRAEPARAVLDSLYLGIIPHLGQHRVETNRLIELMFLYRSEALRLRVRRIYYNQMSLPYDSRQRSLGQYLKPWPPSPKSAYNAANWHAHTLSYSI